jgi:hypothetical protein
VLIVLLQMKKKPSSSLVKPAKKSTVPLVSRVVKQSTDAPTVAINIKSLMPQKEKKTATAAADTTNKSVVVIADVKSPIPIQIETKRPRLSTFTSSSSLSPSSSSSSSTSTTSSSLVMMPSSVLHLRIVDVVYRTVHSLSWSPTLPTTATADGSSLEWPIANDLRPHDEDDDDFEEDKHRQRQIDYIMANNPCLQLYEAIWRAIGWHQPWYVSSHH